MSRPTPRWRPAMRDGVSAIRLVTPAGPWTTVLDFLAERLPLVTRADWRQRLQAGDVLDADGQPLTATAPFQPHTLLWYWRQLPPEPEIPVIEEVLHQDDHLVVVDKPHFLPMTPKGCYVQQTLLVRLKRRLGIETLVPLHRLDRETAGVVAFGVRPDERHAYQTLFRERVVQKGYEAIAAWCPTLRLPRTEAIRLVEAPGERFMQMLAVPGEPNAFTDIALIERRGDWARYQLTPHTGRKHQLRAQMAALGLPLVGDRLYPVLQPAGTPTDLSHPLRLLARTLAFRDPITGVPRHFESRRQLDWPTG